MNYESLKNVSDTEFKRASGVPRETFEAMRQAWLDAQASKRKAGRPSKLSTNDQLLLALSYWREGRTYFHVGKSFGVHESNAQRWVERIENALIRSGRFRLPKPSKGSEMSWQAVAVDVTETPIERPKKNSAAITAASAKPTRSKRRS